MRVSDNNFIQNNYFYTDFFSNHMYDKLNSSSYRIGFKINPKSKTKPQDF